MEELTKGAKQADIINNLSCSYGTITAAKEYFSHYPNSEKLIPVDNSVTTIATTPTTPTTTIENKKIDPAQNGSSPRAVRDQLNFLETQLAHLKVFGKSVSVSELQETYTTLRLHREALKYAVDNWLSTRKSKFTPQAERNKKEMAEIYEWLMTIK